MAILTLTSDMGTKDHFVAVVKGFIYSQLKDVQIVDISHQISPFSIAEAAFILRNSYFYFPEKSIHLINVDANNSLNDSFIAVKFHNHYFLGSNNGVISLVTDQQADEMYEIEIEKKTDTLFPLKNIIAPAACRLASKFNMSAVGKKLSQINMVSSLNPTLEPDTIRGMVIYVDNYGNAITNISKKLIDKYNFTKIKIEFSRNEMVDTISETYSDVFAGDALCLFGTSGLLEIAINKASASKLFGLQLNSKVLVSLT